MTRALMAVFRSRSIGLISTLHLSPAEVVVVALRLAVDHAEKGGINTAALTAALGDAIAPTSSKATTEAAMQAEVADVIAQARTLVAAVTTDDSGRMIGNQWTGGNGGLLSRETLVVADQLRLALDAHDQAQATLSNGGAK